MNIKIARIKKGLTQKQLRELVGVAPTTIVKIEKGIFDNVTYSQMLKFSKVLETPVTELFFS